MTRQQSLGLILFCAAALGGIIIILGLKALQ